MHAYIDPPKRVPLLIRVGLFFTKRVTKKDLLAPKILAWYPKAAFSSGVLESLVAHGKKDLNKRILKLVRVQSSLIVDCPFCIDMNSFAYKEAGVSEKEMRALVNGTDPAQIASFSVREALAVQYTKLIGTTPVLIPAEFIDKLRSEFTEREIVILSSTAAQVDYWARLLKALGVPPAGFLDQCDLPEIGPGGPGK